MQNAFAPFRKNYMRLLRDNGEATNRPRTQHTLVNLGQNCKRIMQPVTSTAVPRTITVCSCFAVGFVLNIVIMMMRMRRRMRRRRRRIQVIGINLGNTLHCNSYLAFELVMFNMTMFGITLLWC